MGKPGEAVVERQHHRTIETRPEQVVLQVTVDVVDEQVEGVDRRDPLAQGRDTVEHLA
ncbi:hypothetical protein D3C85_1653800 [compost metagenome]